MKAVIVYDSYYGNTKAAAEAIAEELKAEGHQADLRSVRQKYRVPPEGEILFLGSPVRMGSQEGEQAQGVLQNRDIRPAHGGRLCVSPPVMAKAASRFFAACLKTGLGVPGGRVV